MTNDELHEMGVTARRLEREIAKHGEVTYRGFTIRSDTVPSDHHGQYTVYILDGVDRLFTLMYSVVVWIEGAGEEYRRRKHLPDVEQ